MVEQLNINSFKGLALKNKEEILSILEKVERKGIENVINFLKDRDFFTAPASTRFHGNYEGGLAEHSLNVYNLLSEKNKRYDLGLGYDTLAITSLLHDICKVDLYHKCNKNRKNEKTQKWESYVGWGYEDSFPCGHGEKSIIMLQNFIKLTKEEILMIRWHMGATESKEILNNLSTAFNMYKGALALHTADMEASYILEKTVEL